MQILRLWPGINWFYTILFEWIQNYVDQCNISYCGEVSECPPCVHRINVTEPYNLSDYQYSPSGIEFSAGIELVTTMVHSIHFRNQSLAVDENSAIKKLCKTLKKPRDTNSKLYFLSFHGRRDIFSAGFNCNITGCIIRVGDSLSASLETQ